jgi:hypothetical protein
MEGKKLEEILRVIELCKSVQGSSADPFDVDIREKIALLKKHLPDWKFLDELLLDSEAMLELAQIVKLQDEWLKHRASSLYIDPLLVQLKVRLLTRDELVEAFIKSWHPIAQLDQLAPKGLERAFVYWRDLSTMDERFKDQFGNYGAGPGVIDLKDLVDLRIFTEQQFEDRLSEIHDELMKQSNGEWVDYRKFIQEEAFEKKVIKAYLLAFLISEGRASLKTDPLSGAVWVAALDAKAGGVPKSVAISVTGDN